MLVTCIIIIIILIINTLLPAIGVSLLNNQQLEIDIDRAVLHNAERDALTTHQE